MKERSGDIYICIKMFVGVVDVMSGLQISTDHLAVSIINRFPVLGKHNRRTANNLGALLEIKLLAPRRAPRYSRTSMGKIFAALPATVWLRIDFAHHPKAEFHTEPACWEQLDSMFNVGLTGTCTVVWSHEKANITLTESSFLKNERQNRHPKAKWIVDVQLKT